MQHFSAQLPLYRELSFWYHNKKNEKDLNLSLVHVPLPHLCASPLHSHALMHVFASCFLTVVAA